MKQDNLASLFSAIRQLPVEVKFGHIETFVTTLQSDGKPVDSKRKFRWENTNLVVACLAAISMAILTGVYFYSESTNEPLSSSDKMPNMEQGQLNLLEQLPAIDSISVEANPEPAPGTDYRKNHPEKVPADTMVAEIAAVIEPEPVVLQDAKTVDPVAESATTHEPDDEADSDTPLRIRTYTSSFCNFDGENEWIHAFVKALIQDKIIVDTLNLHFLISKSFFKVNGKNQQAGLVKSYNELYTSITGLALSNESRISLSVGESSCSLSKTVEE